MCLTRVSGFITSDYGNYLGLARLLDRDSQRPRASGLRESDRQVRRIELPYRSGL